MLSHRQIVFEYRYRGKKYQVIFQRKRIAPPGISLI